MCSGKLYAISHVTLLILALSTRAVVKSKWIWRGAAGYPEPMPLLCADSGIVLC